MTINSLTLHKYFLRLSEHAFLHTVRMKAYTKFYFQVCSVQIFRILTFKVSKTRTVCEILINLMVQTIK